MTGHEYVLTYTDDDVAWGIQQIASKGEVNIALGDRTWDFVPSGGTGDERRDAYILRSYAKDIDVDYGTLLRYRRVARFYTGERRRTIAGYLPLQVPYRVIQAAATSTRGNLSPEGRWAALVLLLERKKATFDHRITEAEYINTLGVQQEKTLEEGVQQALPLLEAGALEAALELLADFPQKSEFGRLLAGWQKREAYKRPGKETVKEDPEAVTDLPDDLATLTTTDLLIELNGSMENTYVLISRITSDEDFGVTESDMLIQTLTTAQKNFGKIIAEIRRRFAGAQSETREMANVAT